MLFRGEAGLVAGVLTDLTPRLWVSLPIRDNLTRTLRVKHSVGGCFWLTNFHCDGRGAGHRCPVQIRSRAHSRSGLGCSSPWGPKSGL
jgi:hypothetical protein